MARLPLWTAASLALFLACGQRDPAVRHTVVSQDLSELRSQFNADTGQVRAIFLAAPT
jgi:hypothetical protein